MCLRAYAEMMDAPVGDFAWVVKDGVRFLVVHLPNGHRERLHVERSESLWNEAGGVMAWD